MASDRQIAANRKNAKKSTGPSSEAGKRRSSKNAVRHRLASSNSRFPKEIVELARLLSGAPKDADPTFVSIDAADAQMTLVEVKKMKTETLGRFLKGDRTCDDTHQMNEELRKLDRYEQRALRRRKRALKAF
jgi:hypothetical protein